MVAQKKSIEFATNESFPWDTFSHRLEPYEGSVVEIQSKIAQENLARKYFGKISGASFFSVSLKDVTSYHVLVEKLLGILNVLKSKKGNVVSFANRKHNTIFIACYDDDFSIEFKSKLEDSPTSDYDDDYYPSTVKENDYTDGCNFSFEIVGLDSRIQKILEEFKGKYDFLFSEKKDDKKVAVKFAYPGLRGNIEIEGRKFSSLPIEAIAENYKTSVIDQVHEMLEVVSNSQHGLVTINGPVGTGKSYLLRAILTELEKQNRRGVVCTPALKFLESAGVLIPVTSIGGKTAIILEDVGDLLVSDSSSRYLNETSNLLNFSEGLLSLLADCIVFLTFNHEIDKISDAIVRHGRCLAQIEVPLLPFEHAQKLVTTFTLTEKREYSLSEVYEMRRVAKNVTKRKTRATNTAKPLGFSR